MSKNALADAREEILDHKSFIEIYIANSIWLPVARLKSAMNVSDTE